MGLMSTASALQTQSLWVLKEPHARGFQWTLGQGLGKGRKSEGMLDKILKTLAEYTLLI